MKALWLLLLICVITSDLGYIKFGPFWTDLFIDKSMTNVLATKNLEKKFGQDRSVAIHHHFFLYSNHIFDCRISSGKSLHYDQKHQKHFFFNVLHFIKHSVFYRFDVFYCDFPFAG